MALGQARSALGPTHLGGERMDTFDRDIQRLGALSQNPETHEAFLELYQELLERTYTEMVRVANTDKLLAGEYRARGEMLKAILERQLDFLGLAWPPPREQEGGQGKMN